MTIVPLMQTAPRSVAHEGPLLGLGLFSERATGIEPATFSLGTSQEQPEISTGYGALDLRGTFGTARALLAALAQGEQPDALANELADRVLAEEAVRLALKVRNGGPHVWRRAIELAGVVLAAERAAMAVAKDS